MHLVAFIVSAFLLPVLGQNSGGEGPESPSAIANRTCVLVSENVSPASEVFYPGQPNYAKGISHWASSSTEFAKCVIEPGTPTDVARILQIVGSTRTPFAVKGGGHATNPGFSSTTGVQIAMYWFSEITYNATEQTVVVGAGLIWDDIYAALAPHGVNVIGGRVSGVGIAGFILGGGYSWKTNQYGLTIDTVTAFELVKPDGSILYVTENTYPDLFFGLKGGSNNFGVVTRFTLRTFPQTDVWGGLITILGLFTDRVSAATVDFSANVKDPKASIITTYNFFLGQPIITLVLFYDSPNPPPGVFDKFLEIPYLSRDVKTRDFLSLVKAGPSNIVANQRGIFNTVAVTDYTPSLLRAVANETIYWGSRLTNLFNAKSGTLISYSAEPFLPNIFAHSSSPSAYPPARSTSYSPFNIYYAWLSDANDEEFYDAIRQTATRLYNVAIAEGQQISDAPLYNNYAIFGTALERMYGNSVPRLQALKKVHDPDNVMGLAGGFKF